MIEERLKKLTNIWFWPGNIANNQGVLLFLLKRK